jgi:hypothetical protein
MNEYSDCGGLISFGVLGALWAASGGVTARNGNKRTSGGRSCRIQRLIAERYGVSYNTNYLSEMLLRLRSCFRQPLIVIWDRSQAHRARVVNEHLNINI